MKARIQIPSDARRGDAVRGGALLLFLAGTWKNYQPHFNAEQELVADGQVKLSQQVEDCRRVTKIAVGERFISSHELAESALFQ